MQAQRTGIAAQANTGKGHRQIRLAVAADLDAAVAMVRRCSPTTLYHRFHGFGDPVDHIRRQWDGSTGLVLLAWEGQRCVGIGELAGDAWRRAELGILVEDTWQRRGIGMRLLATLVHEAAVRRVGVLHADVLAEDAFLVEVLRRIGPVTASWHADGIGVDISISAQGRRDG